MPWNGRGPTVFPAAVLRSESLSQASVYSRKSRVHPGRSGGAALASNVSVTSSPGANTTHIAPRARRRGRRSQGGAELHRGRAAEDMYVVFAPGDEVTT